MSHEVRLYFYSYVKAGVDRKTGKGEGLLEISRIMSGKVLKDDIKKYHIRIYKFFTNEQENAMIQENVMIFLEEMFAKFNSEENPLSALKYQKKIKEMLAHTSMNVGDVIQIDNDYYVVKGMGFKKLD